MFPPARTTYARSWRTREVVIFFYTLLARVTGLKLLEQGATRQLLTIFNSTGKCK